GADARIYLFDADSGDRVDTLTGHDDVVTAVAWSPDGATLASTAGGPPIRPAPGRGAGGAAAGGGPWARAGGAATRRGGRSGGGAGGGGGGAARGGALAGARGRTATRACSTRSTARALGAPCVRRRCCTSPRAAERDLRTSRTRACRTHGSGARDPCASGRRCSVRLAGPGGVLPILVASPQPFDWSSRRDTYLIHIS